MLINNQEFKQYKNTQYFINNKGDIYSQYSDTFLKPMLRKHGGNKIYRYIDIQDKETHKQKHTLVHRMVADTWLRPLQKGEQVNHINDDSLDNRVENLEWVSASTNVKHAVSMGLFHITEDKNSWKLTEEDALETLNNAILEGNSIVISPRDFGVYKSAFQKVEVE